MQWFTIQFFLLLWHKEISFTSFFLNKDENVYRFVLREKREREKKERKWERARKIEKGHDRWEREKERERDVMTGERERDKSKTVKGRRKSVI